MAKWASLGTPSKEFSIKAGQVVHAKWYNESCWIEAISASAFIVLLDNSDVWDIGETFGFNIVSPPDEFQVLA